jgi:hypothetical protein
MVCSLTGAGRWVWLEGVALTALGLTFAVFSEVVWECAEGSAAPETAASRRKERSSLFIVINESQQLDTGTTNLCKITLF